MLIFTIFRSKYGRAVTVGMSIVSTTRGNLMVKTERQKKKQTNKEEEASIASE